jgi:aryl carrier-like protein
MEIEPVIRQTFAEVLESAGQTMSTPLTHESVLLRTGLDSLGFAILVARLEETLGYDPFVLMTTPVYPQTFGEFLAIYQQFNPIN